MKVWATRRREDGAALAGALPVVEGAGLLELLVVDVTLEGNRRPSKVARLQPIGQQRILAQMAMPRPVKLQGWNLVLSGLEALTDEFKRKREVAQTWVCKFHVPENAIGFRAKDMYQAGSALPKSAVRDGSGTRGTLMVAGEYSNALQRYTTCAEMRHHKISTFPAGRLVDCYMEWMSEESFELGGMRVWPAHEETPERIERAGWLVEIDIKERELTKREARMLR